MANQTPRAKDIDILRALTGNSLIEWYGPTRSGKTFAAIKMAIEAVDSGQKAEYWDTEGNVTGPDKQKLGKAYKQIITWDDLVKAIDELYKNNRKLDVLIIDSMTLPLLGVFASKNQKDRGELYMKLSELAYQLKVWTARNDSLCIFTAQDKSELSREVTGERYDPLQRKKVQEFWQEPVGGKSQFFIKEIMRIVPVLRSPEKTTAIMYAHACRMYGRGAALADLTITAAGVKIDWRINPTVKEAAPQGISDHSLADFIAAIDAAMTDEELGSVSATVPWKLLLPEQHHAIGDAGKARKAAIEKGESNDTRAF